MIGYILKKDDLRTIEVIEFVGYDKNMKNKYYKIICSLCSKDQELFYKDFIMSSSNIKKGRIPCGCSSCPNWDETQTKVLVTRKSNNRFYVGDYDSYIGRNTKVNLTCIKCNHKWKPSVSSILSGKGCDKCARKQSSIDRSNKKAEGYLIKYLSEKGYIFVGWEFGKYENTFSKFQFMCPIHGEKWGTYNNIINHKRGCSDCTDKGGGFDRTSDVSYLYLVEWTNDMGYSWLKYGITNNMSRRIKQIKNENLRKNGRVLLNRILHVFTGSGGDIASIESSIKNLVGKSPTNKSEMYSGFTECTSKNNLSKIISLISENHLQEIPYDGTIDIVEKRSPNEVEDDE
ncbi:meiotically up-regulated protein 113 [Aeromonas phage ZPAH1]|nr:meiotically up-regulated protein 113 [Aeromonas phage ZPAH1]